MEHISVMLNSCIEGLDIKEDGIYVDGTLGRAGHSKEILKKLTTGHLYAFDIDDTAIEKSKAVLDEISDNYTLIKANFANMKEELAARGVEKVDGILLDIGVSSPQFDDPERGFSYRFDARLDMRMDQNQSLDAYKIVNEYEFNDLYRVIREYGEDPFAKQIARKIEAARSIKPIETTFELVEIIKSALPAKVKNKPGHPAKQTFQALRIETNGELTSLSRALENGLEILNVDGRMAVISFHSLEDEIVKKAFKKASSVEQLDKRIPLKASEIEKPMYSLVNKKPILADEDELNYNHRSHSAKLRIIKRDRV